MGNLQLPKMAVSPVPIIFLAPLDYMVADAAGLPVEGEESFTLLPEQFRPLYPVCEAHTSGNKRLTHPDRPVGRLCLMFAGQPAKAQTDSLFLSVDQLFERGVQHSLQLQADALKEAMAQERTRTARTSSLPDLQVGLKGGFVGQPVVWERGLSGPTYPDIPDWSQNYAIDFSQPLYQGGKIRRTIHKAEMEKQVAELQTLTDQAEIQLTVTVGSTRVMPVI